MIKFFSTLLLIGVSTGISHAQQTRTVGDFTGIKTGDAFKVLISQSDVNSVKVDAPDNVQAQIKTDVVGGILTITADGNIKTDKPVKISIGAKSLSSLDVTGSGEVKSENQLIVDKISIKSNGAGDLHLDLKANEIIAMVSGAGDVSLKGTAKSLQADVSGAGDLKATNLEVDKAKVKASGAGDAKINVKQSIDADVSGAGSIIYKGNPTERNVNITGAGSVRESKSGNGDETAGDTTKFRLGKKKYMIIGDGDEATNGMSKKDSARSYNRDFKHWAGYEYAVNGYLDFNNSLNTAPGAKFLELNYSKSYKFGLNLFEKDVHIYKNYVNLVMGIGFDFNHYAFKNNYTMKYDSSNYIVGVKDTMNFKKNNLNLSYLKVPLMLEFNTSKKAKNNFHVAVGVEMEYLIHSVTKQKFDADDYHFKIKRRDNYNIDPFKFSAMARVGFNRVTLFAEYALNRLFQEGKGPQEYPFAIGVCLAFNNRI